MTRSLPASAVRQRGLCFHLPVPTLNETVEPVIGVHTVAVAARPESTKERPNSFRSVLPWCFRDNATDPTVLLSY